MKTGKITIALIGMFVLGALGFWALAALVQFRIGRPVATQQVAATAGNPLDILRQGARESIEMARIALQRGDKSKAAAALDAAKRATEVGRDVKSDTFKGVFDFVKQARYALQDGDCSKAQEFLKDASDVLSKSNPSSGTTAILTTQNFGDAYRGATVLNAQGVRIGEVEQGEESRATLVVGGKRDLLGFIDLSGGRHIEVSLKDLILGKPKNLGSTMVVLPTLAVSPERVAKDAIAQLR